MKRIIKVPVDIFVDVETIGKSFDDAKVYAEIFTQLDIVSQIYKLSKQHSDGTKISINSIHVNKPHYTSVCRFADKGNSNGTNC